VSSLPVTAGAASWVIEDTSRHHRQQQIDLTGFAWPFGDTTWFGAALWWGVPLVDDGLIPVWNDALYLELGAAGAYYSFTPIGDQHSNVGLVPMGGVRWNFYLTRDWTVFVTGKVGARFLFGELAQKSLALAFSVGAFWRLSHAVELRLETGNLGFAQVGVSFPL